MRLRELRVVDTDEPLGVVGLDDNGEPFADGVDGILDPADVPTLLADGWSNGYVYLGPIEDDSGVLRAAGHDVTPGHDELHHYWTRGEGLAKWAESPKPWTTLVAHLTKHVGLRKAKIFASRWFIEVFGYAAGSDKNRVAHGHPPRGHRVGPG